MPPAPAPIGLAELAGVRRLAGALVRGDAEQDDLAQETVLVALERPPRAGYAPASWLAGIARRLARNRRRRDARRVRHEAAAARPEATAASLDVAAHLERRRLVLAAVAALPPDVAQLLCLRYFDDLPPRTIAARLALPVETVRTRTKRALARLRAQLDTRAEGGREAWMVALAPLVGGAAAGTPVAPSPPTAPSSSTVPTSPFAPIAPLEGLVMASTTKLALASAAALALAGGGYLVFATGAGGRGDPGAAAGRTDVAGHVVDGQGAVLAGAPLAPSPRADTVVTASPTPASAAPPIDRTDGGIADGGSASGRVLDADGRPLVGATVRLVPDGALPYYLRAPLPTRWSVLEATTDATGRWTLRGIRPRDGYALLLGAVGCATTRVGDLTWRPREEAASVEARLGAGASVEGRVVDGRGTPVAGARVAIGARAGNPLGFVLVDPDLVPFLDADVTTDATGRFRAAHVGAGDHVVVVAKPGFARRCVETPVPQAGVASVADVVLAASGTISGRVAFGDGAPATGARVLVTLAEGEAGYAADVAADGTFTIDHVPPGTGPIYAFLAGLAPIFGPPVATGTTGLDLRFARPSRLVGRVLERDGVPVPRFAVRAVPATDAPDVMLALAEQAVARVLGPTEVHGATGEFALEPLEPRAYRVEVVAEGFAPATVGPVDAPAAGTSAPVEVRLERQGALEGVVVDPEGHAVAGASLCLQAAGRAWSTPDVPSGSGIRILVGGPAEPVVEVRSGPDGRFAFPRLPPGRHGLTVRADGYAPWFSAGIDPGVAREPVRVALARGGTIVGRVTSLAPSPAPSPSAAADRRVRATGPLGFLDAPVGADGTFRLEHVPAGPWLVLPLAGTMWTPSPPDEDVAALERWFGAGRVEVSEGGEVAHDLALAPLPWLEVRVDAAAGVTVTRVEDVAGHRIVVEPSGTRATVGPFVVRGERTAAGTFVLRDLVPGTYELSAFVSIRGADAAGRATDAVVTATRTVEVGADAVGTAVTMTVR